MTSTNEQIISNGPISKYEQNSFAHLRFGLVNAAVAEMGMGKPPFKASEGGLMDILRELEEITQSELQQGSGT